MTDFLNTMLISPAKIKEMSLTNINLDDVDLAASIRVSQKVYLRDVIGDALLEKIQQLVYNAIKGLTPTINDPENAMYKTLLDDYIKNVLAYKAVCEVCARISLKIRNIGVSKNSDTNIQAAQLSEIQSLRSEYETYFNDAANRMIDFLKANKDSFEEIVNDCPCGKKLPRLNAKYANNGLWLG